MTLAYMLLCPSLIFNFTFCVAFKIVMENVFNRSQSNRAEVIRIIDLFSLENAAVKSSSFIVIFYT